MGERSFKDESTGGGAAGCQVNETTTPHYKKL